MITNNFNKELRGISDALRDLGYTDSTIGLRQRYWKEYCFFHGSLDIDEASMDEFLLKNYDIQSGNINVSKRQYEVRAALRNLLEYRRYGKIRNYHTPWFKDLPWVESFRAICISSYLTKHLAGTRNLSSNTIKSYRDTFCLLLLFMKEMNKKIDRICLVDIDADLVIRFLDWLEVNRGNSASTRNVRLAAIHAFFRYVQFQNPEMLLHCQRILAIPMKETEKRFVEYLPEQALRELLSLPDQTKKYGIRDTALLCLLYDSGARVQELIDLSLLDIRLETPATIRLYGKGRKVRVVPLMSQTATILQKYLNMWHLDAARKPDDPVFVNHQGKRLTRPGVTYILNKYMAQVSWMEGKKGITPHIIRHSKAMHLLRADVDLHYIRDFLGHVQIETTEVYARADAEMKRKALETANLDLPAESQTSWQKDQSLLSWLQSL